MFSCKKTCRPHTLFRNLPTHRSYHLSGLQGCNLISPLHLSTLCSCSPQLRRPPSAVPPVMTTSIEESKWAALLVRFSTHDAQHVLHILHGPLSTTTVSPATTTRPSLPSPTFRRNMHRVSHPVCSRRRPCICRTSHLDSFPICLPYTPPCLLVDQSDITGLFLIFSLASCTLY